MTSSFIFVIRKKRCGFRVFRYDFPPSEKLSLEAFLSWLSLYTLGPICRFQRHLFFPVVFLGTDGSGQFVTKTETPEGI